MKNSWFFSLALLLFTCSIQAQSRFEFWPQGHINVLADFKGGYYVTMGGPSFTLLKKDQLQAGVHFAPSLRIKPSAPEGREIMPLQGLGLFVIDPNKKVRYNLLSYYDSPAKKWTAAIGIGFYFNAK
ncbi:MAG TPA: hypothetical protein DEQ44_07025 [Flavobacteriaceae bacterium]|jgi:hypothetical protein|nr:hypothetical protein [Flavobacteriaceae bacterium]